MIVPYLVRDGPNWPGLTAGPEVSHEQGDEVEENGRGGHVDSRAVSSAMALEPVHI